MTPRRSQRKSRPAWSMFPHLHHDVSRLLQVEGHVFTFYNVDNDDGCIQNYDTSILGEFHCPSRKCQKIWSSKQVAITIRMYSDERYNARVYYQRCQACKALGKPTLDSSYAERVAYRLLKWSGVEQERPVFSGESRGPHRSELCEGCRAGHCAEGSRVDGLLAEISNLSLGGT